MRHLCRHVRIVIIIIVIIGLARPWCVLACPSPLRDWRGGRVYIRHGCRGRTRARQHARTKIDEDEMKESWFLGWLGNVRSLCRLRSCLPSSLLESGAMKGKKRVSAQNRRRRREG